MSLPILDTHEHLWDLEARPYSWTNDLPPLKKSFLPADYAKATAGTGISKSLHMEADVDEAFMEDENVWIESLANDPDNPISGAIISGRPENDGFDAYLEKWATRDFVKALRRVLHVMPDETSQSDLYADNVNKLVAYTLVYDICALERQLPLALNLVRKCPAMTFVLDHCGVPAIAEGNPEGWRESIRALAEHPNVNCKVSGVVAYADPEKPIADQVKPYIDDVIEAFGWDRLVFGSDWPVCTSTSNPTEWVNILLDHISGVEEENQRKLLHDNAARIYHVS